MTAGPTPFIKNVGLQLSGGTIASATVSIQPKPDSFTRSLVTTYSAAYLNSQGLIGATTATVPVFGLYAGYTNSVTMLIRFVDGSSSLIHVPIPTESYTDPCDALNHLTVQNNRRAAYDLSYDYFLAKDSCGPNSPAIIDTDGNIRWVGTANVGTQASIFYDNAIYASDGATGVNRIDLTGRVTKVGDYASAGITYTGHHNFDPGRDGIVMDVNTTTQTESVDVEIDAHTGNVLNTWDLGAIISAAMTAGGDNPSQFVFPVGTDWFHNNATTYDRANNLLIVSSRENFVIAIDYDTPNDGIKKIHWILGDPTKKWFQFPSLRRFALSFIQGALPPLGQHSVSIDSRGNLLLFDDGQASFFQSPPGQTRTYSAVRSYTIDAKRMTAKSFYTYSPQPAIYSDICSSVYEGRPSNYLVDFSAANNRTTNIVQGIGQGSRVVFSITYPEKNSCGSGWNAFPITQHAVAY